MMLKVIMLLRKSWGGSFHGQDCSWRLNRSLVKAGPKQALLHSQKAVVAAEQENDCMSDFQTHHGLNFRVDSIKIFPRLALAPSPSPALVWILSTMSGLGCLLKNTEYGHGYLALLKLQLSLSAGMGFLVGARRNGKQQVAYLKCRQHVLADMWQMARCQVRRSSAVQHAHLISKDLRQRLWTTKASSELSAYYLQIKDFSLERGRNVSHLFVFQKPLQSVHTKTQTKCRTHYLMPTGLLEGLDAELPNKG